MLQIEHQTPTDNPRFMEHVIERTKFRYGTNRPWTSQFLMQNAPYKGRKKVFIEPIENWSYFRGDRVEVLVGRDKGKQGLISQVIQERNWVIVDGLNTHLRIAGARDDFPGVVIKSEAPLLVTTDIALVDPSDLLTTEFEWRYTEDGQKVRVSLRTGRVIPIPATNDETYDYKSPNVYVERPKDTTAAEANKITFAPKLKTFEMDVMDEMKIEEERVPKRTYWH